MPPFYSRGHWWGWPVTVVKGDLRPPGDLAAQLHELSVPRFKLYDLMPLAWCQEGSFCPASLSPLMELEGFPYWQNTPKQLAHRQIYPGLSLT